MRSLVRHCEFATTVNADAATLFAFLDDPRRLGAHMQESSWMMAGSRMDYRLDAAAGKAVGSLIRLSGRFLGIALAVEEIVTMHEPGREKRWATQGTPRLLVIGPYEMGFRITSHGGDSELMVFINYQLPAGAWRIAGWLLSGWYARWCVRRMAADAARHFPPPHAADP